MMINGHLGSLESGKADTVIHKCCDWWGCCESEVHWQRDQMVSSRWVGPAWKMCIQVKRHISEGEWPRSAWVLWELWLIQHWDVTCMACQQVARDAVGCGWLSNYGIMVQTVHSFAVISKSEISWSRPIDHPLTLQTLKQLPIPEKPWNSISMNFIEKLPPSSGYTSILVIIDFLSKQSLFIPTHDTITSPQLAQLFILHVFSSKVSQATSLLIKIWNLYPTFSSPSELYWTWSFTSLPYIILKVMDKLNEIIRLWNSISESIATTNKTTGPNSFH